MTDGAAARRHVMLVAGETSGDALGAVLMDAMTEISDRPLEFSGVGGPEMEARGLTSIFPMHEIAVMGPREIIPRLPLIFRRIWQTVRHAVEQRPDIVVVIDSPEFTHMVAKRIARRAPDIPIVDYVLPSVWAWRLGRARAMKKYIRRVLALLPFEPKFLGTVGVDCVYVGHPAIQRIPEEGSGARFRGARGIGTDDPVLLVLPGSRLNEVKHLVGIFGETVRQLSREIDHLRVVVPVVPHVRPLVEASIKDWGVPVEIVDDEQQKRAAFDAGTAALAASGTVSLELALARVPMVVAYRAEAIVGWFALNVLKVPSVVLVNLILDRPSVREYLQGRCTADELAEGLRPLMHESDERRRILDDLDELRLRMGIDGEPPGRRAARAVLELL
ncbi:lipid-A-disaccharide synthase [Parvibaculum sp.]|uniref:lipid-A-disaccharide synthase n=1 Tax=Parvibaculum sp. TaxID=2024848 RepID=UPI001B15B0CB|nr:lipid-A-disaccharide synthase [Parvibaculum sp.]MBO6636061.1 lipid-A-disaccharide synthase [Parvibaculum sp.]MBO6680352.1 lipid-A-disaccharide synthase [Parvibaculum sp.]MBO6686338.1 lipid-A-disaccharide synthase [Parvibaculum sp.]MBO6906152.1 lipid-A-disaccharide synthase [Parvibaculum sp.]